MYKVRPKRTPPQGLIMLSFILMFSVFAYHILMFAVIPTYSTFGNQSYCKVCFTNESLRTSLNMSVCMFVMKYLLIIATSLYCLLLIKLAYWNVLCFHVSLLVILKQIYIYSYFRLWHSYLYEFSVLCISVVQHCLYVWGSWIEFLLNFYFIF